MVRCVKVKIDVGSSNYVITWVECIQILNEWWAHIVHTSFEYWLNGRIWCWWIARQRRDKIDLLVEYCVMLGSVQIRLFKVQMVCYYKMNDKFGRILVSGPRSCCDVVDLICYKSKLKYFYPVRSVGRLFCFVRRALLHAAYNLGFLLAHQQWNEQWSVPWGNMGNISDKHCSQSNVHHDGGWMEGIVLIKRVKTDLKTECFHGWLIFMQILICFRDTRMRDRVKVATFIIQAHACSDYYQLPSQISVE